MVLQFEGSPESRFEMSKFIIKDDTNGRFLDHYGKGILGLHGIVMSSMTFRSVNQKQPLLLPMWKDSCGASQYGD